MDKDGKNVDLDKKGNLHSLLTTLQSSMSDIQSSSGKNFLAKDKKNIDNLLKTMEKSSGGKSEKSP